MESRNFSGSKAKMRSKAIAYILQFGEQMKNFSLFVPERLQVYGKKVDFSNSGP